MSVWDDLDALIDEFWGRGEELAVRFEVGTESMWSGEIRWTQRPNTVRPDRSVVFYVACGETPESLISELIGAVRDEANRSSRGTCTDCKKQGGPCWCGDALGCTC